MSDDGGPLYPRSLGPLGCALGELATVTDLRLVNSAEVEYASDKYASGDSLKELQAAINKWREREHRLIDRQAAAYALLAVIVTES